MSVVPYRAPMATPERPWVGLLVTAAELARTIAETEFVPKALRHNPAAVTACILYGDEVGLGPMMSLAKIAMVDGKPALAAEAQRALILAAGHSLWPEDISQTRFTWAGRRRGEDIVTRFTWTLDAAKIAGLAGKPNWRAYPQQMLSARSSADLARAIFADVIGGLPALEELQDGAVVAEVPAVAGDAPAATAPSRRRRSRAAVELASAPAAGSPPPPPDDDDDVDVSGAWQPSEPTPPTGSSGAAAEPPSPEPEPADPAMSDAQRKRLMPAFKAAGFTERDTRLTFASRAVGRELASSKDLTEAEASRVIELLDLVKPAGGAVAGSPRRRRTTPAEAAPAAPTTPPSGDPVPDPALPIDTTAEPSPAASPGVGGGAGGDFPHDLPDLAGGVQQVIPVVDPAAVEGWRLALAAMHHDDRDQLEILLMDGDYRQVGDDPAAALAEHWPALEPSSKAATVLRDQLAAEAEAGEPE